MVREVDHMEGGRQSHELAPRSLSVAIADVHTILHLIIHMQPNVTRRCASTMLLRV